MTARTPRLRRVLGAGFLAGALVLAGCSANSDGSTGNAESPPSAPSDSSVDSRHNDADVTFAQDMIVHHQSAIEMADMAVIQARSQEVKDLAGRISAAQGPEINQMTRWLDAWGEPVANGSMSHGSMGSMPGMMTGEQMGRLMAAPGTAFDRMFLEMMTAHHQGAVEMARTEQAEGANSAARELARSIETDQSAEISEMAQLLPTN